MESLHSSRDTRRVHFVDVDSDHEKEKNLRSKAKRKVMKERRRRRRIMKKNWKANRTMADNVPRPVTVFTEVHLTRLLSWLRSPRGRPFLDGIGGQLLGLFGFTNELPTDSTSLSPEMLCYLRSVAVAANMSGWDPDDVTISSDGSNVESNVHSSNETSDDDISTLPAVVDIGTLNIPSNDLIETSADLPHVYTELQLTQLLKWLRSTSGQPFVDTIGGQLLEQFGFTDGLGADPAVLHPEQQQEDFRVIAAAAAVWGGWDPDDETVSSDGSSIESSEDAFDTDNLLPAAVNIGVFNGPANHPAAMTTTVSKLYTELHLTHLLTWLRSTRGRPFVDAIGGQLLIYSGFTDGLGTEPTELHPQQQEALRVLAMVAAALAGWDLNDGTISSDDSSIESDVPLNGETHDTGNALPAAVNIGSLNIPSNNATTTLANGPQVYTELHLALFLTWLRSARGRPFLDDIGGQLLDHYGFTSEPTDPTSLSPQQQEGLRVLASVAAALAGWNVNDGTIPSDGSNVESIVHSSNETSDNNVDTLPAAVTIRTLNIPSNDPTATSADGPQVYTELHLTLLLTWLRSARGRPFLDGIGGQLLDHYGFGNELATDATSLSPEMQSYLRVIAAAANVGGWDPNDGTILLVGSSRESVGHSASESSERQ